MSIFERTELLLGSDAILKLNNCHVLVFGVGGVGGYVCEALARSGVGFIDIVDNDCVSMSNINRQIIATYDNIGLPKVDVMKKRLLSINPKIVINTLNTFVTKDNIALFAFSSYDYVIDCIDTISAKIAIVEACNSNNVKLISSMGAANKLNPMGFMIKDINKTTVDPIARVMRYELRKRGIKKLKVCYSEELPKHIDFSYEGNKRVVGSIATVPSACGLLIANEVILDLIEV